MSSHGIFLRFFMDIVSSLHIFLLRRFMRIVSSLHIFLRGDIDIVSFLSIQIVSTCPWLHTRALAWRSQDEQDVE